GQQQREAIAVGELEPARGLADLLCRRHAAMDDHHQRRARLQSFRGILEELEIARIFAEIRDLLEPRGSSRRSEPAERQREDKSARDAHSPAMHRYLVSRYSSMPLRDPSRPMPDSLIPPKG